ncbi:hypothetical protein N7492_006887 [Penicillium capsulatum]|uniref:Uncharacterized protein n=1 Tax=Penicillium capsulatum TaxID=69766 RepID=A0A9W9LKS3_9EURO|nr:hypothetical protein N7492_006887 [Penicillium capsulatum]
MASESPASSAASINSSRSLSSPGHSSTGSTVITQPDGSDDKGDLQREECFHYLHSLITVSGPSHPSPGPLSTPLVDEQDRQPLRRKRASSRLSLRLGDLPSLPFTSRKPCPRYTAIPPIHTPKPVPMRPEVRF